MQTLRQVFAATAVALACALVAPNAADADSGLGYVDEDQRHVTGSGSYLISGMDADRADVVFVCSVTAGPDAVAVTIRPPAENGCRLYKGTTLLAKAPGISTGAPAAFTMQPVTVDITAPGALEVCWRVEASEIGGTQLTDDGCRTDGRRRLGEVPGVSVRVTNNVGILDCMGSICPGTV